MVYLQHVWGKKAGRTAAGLKCVSCHMNDRVTFLEPEQPDYRELLDSVIKADHWSDEKTDRETEEDISYFMTPGERIVPA